MRTDIEDRIREAKLGAGLIHLPSGYPETNTVWMWAALLAGNLSTLLQALTGAAGGVVPGAADAGVDCAGVYDDRYPVSAGPRVVAARYISAPATTATRMNTQNATLLRLSERPSEPRPAFFAMPAFCPVPRPVQACAGGRRSERSHRGRFSDVCDIRCERLLGVARELLTACNGELTA